MDFEAAFGIAFFPKGGGKTVTYDIWSRNNEGPETFRLQDGSGNDVLSMEVSLEFLFGVMTGLMLGGELRVLRILYHRNRFRETVGPYYRALCSIAERAGLIPTD